MSLVQNFPFFSILLSMAGGIVCSVLKSKHARTVCLTVITAIAIMNGAVLVFVHQSQQAYSYMMGHFPAPWGNEIRIGSLEALMACVFCVVMLLSLLGGMKHIFHDIEKEKVQYYFVMICLLLSSILALIYTNDIFTAYVFIELNTLAACAIVMLKGTKATLVATTQYLIMSLLGSGLFLIGITILYSVTGHLLMPNIQEVVVRVWETGEYQFPLIILICLFAVAMAIKSALYPFHSWLPDAHGSATSSSSAILSGLVLKGYILLFIKIVYRVIGLEVVLSSRVLDVLFFFGLLGMVIGSIKAMKEKDIKRMIAFSSVAQIGYIYVGMGLGNSIGMVAACYHIIVHAVTKPMLFCAAGGFMEVSGESKQFVDLVGAGRRNKMAAAAFLVGSLSMIGIPFFAGFIPKWYLACASITSSGKMGVTLFVLAISTILNAMYYIPVLILLVKKPAEETKECKTHRNSFSFQVAMVIFIALNLLFGIFSTEFIHIIEQGLAMFG